MMSFMATLSRTKDVTHLLHLGEGGGKKGEKKKRNKKGKANTSLWFLLSSPLGDRNVVCRGKQIFLEIFLFHINASVTKTCFEIEWDFFLFLIRQTKLTVIIWKEDKLFLR